MRRSFEGATTPRVARWLAVASLSAVGLCACADTAAPADTVLPEGTIVLAVTATPRGQLPSANALWRVARDGTVRSHPGFTESLYSALEPSADHRRFAYTVGGRLVLDDADATRQVLFQAPIGGVGRIAWSPDARFIAFQRSRSGGGTDVSIVRVADGTVVTPTSTIGGGCSNDPRSPQFFLNGWQSPEQFAFYWSICQAPDRYFVASPTGQLEERPGPHPYRLVAPDGQRVLTYQSERPIVSNTDGSNARPVASFSSWGEARWSPTSRHLVVGERAQVCLPLHLVAADGSGGYRIPDDPACPIALSWSPSGEWIATTLRDSNGAVLRLYRVNGGEMREVPLQLPPDQYIHSAAWIAE